MVYCYIGNDKRIEEFTMPLTHVCMWSKRGWDPVTAEEAAHMHPGGTVAARSGLFMCSLCGQYVTLTDGNVRDRYFKHSKEELSKDCPDRSSSYSSGTSFIAGQHELPIRLVMHSADSFEFEIGLLPIPEGVPFDRKKQVSIIPRYTNDEPYVYSLSRLQRDRVTYLSVGSTPASKYQISVDQEVVFWPSCIEGISTSGTLFDGKSCKKIPYDADVQINCEYYLLTTRDTCTYDRSVQVEGICTKYIAGHYWRLYRVCGKAMTEFAAKFFLELHCRLTENPIEVFPIWPATVQTPYFIHHDTDEIVLYLQGQARAKAFPSSSIREYACMNKNGKVVALTPHGRQQLISAGRTKVLRYTYLWRDKLDCQAEVPKVKVTNLLGEMLESGLSSEIPMKSRITAEASCDGFVTIEKDDTLIERRDLYAGRKIDIQGIQFGYQIKIYQGLDCVWEVLYKRRKKEKLNYDEQEILSKLKTSHGKMMPIPHTIGSTAEKLGDYPLIKRWLYQKIRKGSVQEKAYRQYVRFITGLK